MFAAQHDRKFSICQNDLASLLNLTESHGGISETELQIAAVKNMSVGQIRVLIRTVGLQTERFTADCFAAEASSRAIGRGGIERGAKQDDGRLPIGRVAADEGFNIVIQHRGAAPQHRLAGQKHLCEAV